MECYSCYGVWPGVWPGELLVEHNQESPQPHCLLLGKKDPNFDVVAANLERLIVCDTVIAYLMHSWSFLHLSQCYVDIQAKIYMYLLL